MSSDLLMSGSISEPVIIHSLRNIVCENMLLCLSVTTYLHNYLQVYAYAVKHITVYPIGSRLGKFTFEIDDDLDELFRKIIVKNKGLHKGVIQSALKEAIKEWVEEHK